MICRSPTPASLTICSHFCHGILLKLSRYDTPFAAKVDYLYPLVEFLEETSQWVRQPITFLSAKTLLRVNA